MRHIMDRGHMEAEPRPYRPGERLVQFGTAVLVSALASPFVGLGAAAADANRDPVGIEAEHADWTEAPTDVGCGPFLA